MARQHTDECPWRRALSRCARSSPPPRGRRPTVRSHPVCRRRRRYHWVPSGLTPPLAGPAAVSLGRASARIPQMRGFAHFFRLWVDEHAGVQDAARVEGAFGGPERRREQVRTLPVVAGAVVAPDGVVVRDRPAPREDRLARRRLDLGPLLEL